MSEPDIRPRLRERLKETLSRVPSKVNSGSHQLAVRFKKFHADAMKVANNERATLAQLQSMLNQSADFYQ